MNPLACHVVRLLGASTKCTVLVPFAISRETLPHLNIHIYIYIYTYIGGRPLLLHVLRQIV